MTNFTVEDLITFTEQTFPMATGKGDMRKILSTQEAQIAENFLRHVQLVCHQRALSSLPGKKSQRVPFHR